MAKQNGAQSVVVVSGRRIVHSTGTGKTNIDELKMKRFGKKSSKS